MGFSQGFASSFAAFSKIGENYADARLAAEKIVQKKIADDKANQAKISKANTALETKYITESTKIKNKIAEADSLVEKQGLEKSLIDLRAKFQKLAAKNNNPNSSVFTDKIDQSVEYNNRVITEEIKVAIDNGTAKIADDGSLLVKTSQTAEVTDQDGKVVTKGTESWEKTDTKFMTTSEMFPSDKKVSEQRLADYETYKQNAITSGVTPMSFTAWEAAEKKTGEISAGEESAISTSDAVKLVLRAKNEERPLTTKEMDTLWKVERDFLDIATTKEKDDYTATEGIVTTINGVKNIRDSYQKLIDSGIEGGLLHDITKGILSYVGTGGVISDLGDMDAKQFATVIGLESELTAAQMEIIKDLSGLSYTDKQMEVLQQITGSGRFKTNEAKVGAMSGYIKRQTELLESKTAIGTRFSRKFPHLAYSIRTGQPQKKKPEQPRTTNLLGSSSNVEKRTISGVEYDTTVRVENGERILYVENPATGKWIRYGKEEEE